LSCIGINPSLLQAAQGYTELKHLFEASLKLDPGMEKAHFQYAR
jgi:hypothetical protein